MGPGLGAGAGGRAAARIEAICAGESWILDTAYNHWIDVPLGLQLIVALDLPRAVSLARLVRRTVARVVDGRPVCNGNHESLRQVFSRESIILWHFRAFKSKRARIDEWEAAGRPSSASGRLAPSRNGSAPYGDDPVGARVEHLHRAVRVADDDARRRRRSEAEVRARVLRREVARAGLDLARLRAAARVERSHLGAG